jgi:polyisoprenyl-teichoic acid--peptidoglycan teichoic acid transferase
MADGEKPYRRYRGGRVRGAVPTLERTRAGGRDRADGARRDRSRPEAPKRRRRLRLTRKRVILSTILIGILLFVVWAVASWLAFDRGVEEANQRLSPRARAALVPHEGLLMSRPTVTLLMGTDHADRADRADANRSDSIMLVRTDPKKHRISYLSIPRDLRVDIPGQGTAKINAAFAVGGPALAMRTITAVTGIEINHVALVDFNSFRDLIDELGGVTVNVPAPIVSNRFDCPFPTDSQCQRWQGWRFAKGEQTMNGRRALIYSRIRENRLNPAENDLTRGERQQAVVQAIGDKLTSPGTLLKLPFVGDDLLKPLATDLTSGQFLQLAWLKVRAPEDRTLHCRLGGTASFVGGESFIIGSEENRNVIAMFSGRAAAQPPLPGSGPFGPGCVIGKRG